MTITTTDFCMDYFISLFRPLGNIQCLNCTNIRDEKTRDLIHHADLLVVLFHQNHQELCLWLTNELYRFVNCFYLIMDYFPEKEFNLLHISQEFRMPLSRLACIPYNTEYHEAIRRGNPLKYWRNTNNPGIYQAGMNFRKELNRTALMILHALEE